MEQTRAQIPLSTDLSASGRRQTHLSDTGVADEEKLEEVIVFAGVHGGQKEVELVETVAASTTRLGRHVVAPYFALFSSK